MTTVCAGRFTPHASVAVHTSVLTTPAANILSTSDLSDRSMPALWHPNPLAKSSFTSGFRLLFTSAWNRATSGWSSPLEKRSPWPSASFAASSASWRAVFTVSFRLCTNTIACFPDRSAPAHFRYATSAIKLARFIAFVSVTPTNTCVSGMGRKL